MVNLYYILLNFNDIVVLLSDFLNHNDLIHLGSSCKLLNPLFQSTILNKIHKKYINFLLDSMKKFKQKSQQKFKIIKTPSSTILKMNVFDLPAEFLSMNFWKSLNISTKELQLLLKEEKFIKEQNNMFFTNPQNEIMFLNRTLIDDSLTISLKSEKSNDFSEESKYEKLYTDNELTANSYDFTNIQSMLQRQKKIINTFENYDKKCENNSKQNFEIQLQNLRRMKKICVILCHGGNFSIGIFDKTGKCILHRSDHKYVTRKKAGQRQMGKDKHSGSGIKSIGSQIRRENEKIHQINVENILEESLKEIEDCDLVLLQAPGMNKMLLINENKPLFLIKNKLRSMCLTAKKANYTEVERIFKAISKVYLIIQ